VVAHTGEGECLGEAALLCPGPATASVRVEKKAVLWSMDATELRNYISEHSGGGGALLMGMAQCLSRRVRAANVEILKHHLKPPAIMRVGQSQAITAASLPQVQDPGFFSKLKSSMAREKRVKISTEIKM
jgi:CRP-like cAMP-binding protein